MKTAPHAITKLTLENFRNYQRLVLEIPARPVVLTGHNGAGKTNILEAISLLSPGRGLRNAKLRGIDAVPSPSGGGLAWGLEGTDSATSAPHLTSPRKGEGRPWVVAAEITARGNIHTIGTGRDPETTMEKRILKINGQRERKQSVLTQYISVQWLTPSLDQVFIEGGSARRKLLDRLTYGFDPEHAARVTAYESAMRERNRLLAQGRGADTYWLSILEQQMAEHAIATTLARLDALQRMGEVLSPPAGGGPNPFLRISGGGETSEDKSEDEEHASGHPPVAGEARSAPRQRGEVFFGSFSKFSLSLQGVIETWLGEGMKALEAETKFAERLSDLRRVDALSGRASQGPHRSYLEVMHLNKAMLAEDCSTGEQKAILLAMVIAASVARASWCGLPPILLLDEVVAHLDVDKRGALFDLISGAGIQAWMTGTDAAVFQGLEGFTTHLEIASGTVAKSSILN